MSHMPVARVLEGAELRVSGFVVVEIARSKGAVALAVREKDADHVFEAHDLVESVDGILCTLGTDTVSVVVLVSNTSGSFAEAALALAKFHSQSTVDVVTVHCTSCSVDAAAVTNIFELILSCPRSASALHGSVISIEHPKELSVTADAESKIPSQVQAHFMSEADAYDKDCNPGGIVNFGTAVNHAIPHSVMSVLPSFLTVQDTTYQVCEGSVEFRTWLVDKLVGHHDIEETVTVHSLYGALSLCGHFFRNVAITGVACEDIAFVLSHGLAKAQAVSLSDVDRVEGVRAHWVFVEGSADGAARGVSVSAAVAHCAALPVQPCAPERITVFVLASPDQLSAFSLTEAHRPRVAFAFAYALSATTSCGVMQTAAPLLLEELKDGSYFFPVPSVVQAAAARDQALPHGSFDELTDCVAEMLFKSEGIEGVDRDHFVFGVGASPVLELLGRVLFCEGDVLGIDAPYYLGFAHDFGRSGVTLAPVLYEEGDVYCDVNGVKSVLGRGLGRSTLRLRAQRFLEDGARGCIVCNPHNPTGRVYPAVEIQELCEWAIQVNADAVAAGDSCGMFHVIVDELYAHSVYGDGAVFASAIPYTQRTPCIHVIRGFAKDFGLCGFKVGYGVSSLPAVRAAGREWAPILQPPLAMAAVMTSLLRETDHGLVVFSKNYELLRRRLELTSQELTRSRIPFIVPQAGVFFMIDLSADLDRNPLDNENFMFCRLFRKHKVNVLQGYRLCSRKGWFRFCHVTRDEASLCEGVRRLQQFLVDEMGKTPL